MVNSIKPIWRWLDGGNQLQMVEFPSVVGFGKDQGAEINFSKMELYIYICSMNIKLGKAFLFVKCRPDVFKSMKINEKSLSTVDLRNWNWRLNTLDQMIFLDYQICILVRKVKQQIQKFISHAQSGSNDTLQEKNTLKDNLEELLSTLKKLNFLGIEHSLTGIFQGENGLFALYKYAWSPDILKLLSEINQFFVQYKLEDNVRFFQNKFTKYKRIIDEVISNEANNILKQIKKGMYMMPEGWAQKLQKPPLHSNPIQHHAQCSQEQQFKASFTCLLYLHLQANIYDYIAYLKLVILNKVSGIMSGDYEIWQRLYDVSLKLYSKKDQARKSLQIDQILEQQMADPQFSNFLTKTDLNQISLSSINFYLKNSPKNQREGVRATGMAKILNLLSKEPWKYAEDVIQFMENQALEEEKAIIVNSYSSIIKQDLCKPIPNDELFNKMLGIGELIGYVAPRQHQLQKFLNVEFLKILLQSLKVDDMNNYELIGFMLNSIMIAGYEDCEGVENCLKVEGVCKIVLLIYKKLYHRGYLLHEDAMCLLQECSLITEETCVEEVVKLFLVSGEECDCKFQNFTPEKAENLANWLLKYLKELSDIEFKERKQIEKFLNEKDSFNQDYIKVFMSIKGFKDRLLSENLMNLTVKLKEHLPFAQLTTFALEYMSFLAPYEIHDSILVNGEEYSIFDNITNQFPIECMKLIYKSMNQFQNVEFPPNLSDELVNSYWTDNKGLMDAIYRDTNLTMIEVTQIEQINKAEFLMSMMANVFNKLNQDSQRKIKELKPIYQHYSSCCLRLWSQIYPLILRSQVNALKQQNSYIETLPDSSSKNEKFIKEIVRQNKIPFIQNTMEKHKLLSNIRKFIKIGKVINETLYNQNMNQIINPLIKFKCDDGSHYYEMVRMFQLIESSCPSDMGVEHETLCQNYTNNQQWCQFTLETVSQFKKSLQSIKNRSILDQIMLEDLKLEIIKIFIPYMLKDLLLNKEIKNFTSKVQANFKIFQRICQVIELISPGEEEHLIILLETGEECLLSFKEQTEINRLSQFLFKAIQTLFSFIFKGIRVRSYHLYRFMKSYCKLTGFNCKFFNSVISFYLQKYFNEFVPNIKIPQEILKLCDPNANNQPTQTTSKYQSFTKFEGTFMVSQKICLISMFFNLFSRINFGGLMQGIQTIWSTQQYKLIYIQYLTKACPLLGEEVHKIDQKLCDIMNLDCFGNLSIVLREKRTQKQIQMLIGYLKSALESGIKQKIKESVAIPIKILMEEIKQNELKIDLQSLSYLNEPEDIINIMIASYNTSLQPLIASNLHVANLNYINNGTNSKVIYDMNVNTLETRMSKKTLRQITNNIQNQSKQVKGRVDPEALEIVKKLVNKLQNWYQQSKKGLRKNSGKLFNSLKTLSIILMNNPQLLPFFHSSVLSIMYDALHHNLTVFCELYVLMIRTNSGFQDHPALLYPHSLHYEITVKLQLQKMLQQNEPKYLIDALLFVLKSSQYYRFRFYRFSTIHYRPYQNHIKAFQKQLCERLLKITKKLILSTCNVKVFLLMNYLLGYLMEIGQSNLQNQQTPSIGKIHNNYQVEKVTSSYDPLRSKKINQEVLKMGGYKELSGLLQLQPDSNEELEFLEKMLDYSLKNNEVFQQQLVSIYLDENKKKSHEYQALFGRMNFDEIEEEECDGVVEDCIIENDLDEIESYGSMEIINSPEEVPKSQLVRKDTLMEMYENSIFNPEQIKNIISLLSSVSTSELKEFRKNIDEQLGLWVEKELFQRGQGIIVPVGQGIKFKQISQQSVPTQRTSLIPQLNQKVVVSLIYTSYAHQESKKVLDLIVKLFAKNDQIFVKKFIQLLLLSDEEYENTQVGLKQLKKYILHTIINELVKKHIQMNWLMYRWDDRIIIEEDRGQPILQILLKQGCILEVGESETNDNLIKNLIAYFEQIDQTGTDFHLQLEESLIKRLIEKISEKKIVLSQNPNIMNYFNLLIYIDPLIFEHYFSMMVEKLTVDLGKIISKQQKIFQSFINSGNGDQQDQTTKEENYWNYRENKKGQKYDEDLEYIRNVMVDFSVHLMPHFKQMRLNSHIGTELNKSKQELAFLQQKQFLNGCPSLLKQIRDKQIQIEEWKRTQLNSIINLQIRPIIEEHSEEFIKVLSEAETFLNDFIDFFKPKSTEQQLIIYNACGKIYEVILATDLLTKEEKQNYHSMSKIKTRQTVESSKYLNSYRRRSSLNINLSINPMFVSAYSLLRKLGTSCSFLSQYLGSQAILRETHAKYCDFENKIKILWLNKPHKKLEKSMICERDKILQTSMPKIDNDFATHNLKIQFEGEIGLDYGGVSREWLTLLVKAIINPDLGLFQLSANKRTFQPSRSSYLIPNHLSYFMKFGMIVGKAMQENWLLELNLTKSFLKHLLGTTLYVQDLEDIDPDTAKSLKWMLQNDIGNEDLGLNFTHEKTFLGEKKTIELVSGGSEMIVKERNKKEYIKLLANHLMTQSIRQQAKAFMKGLQTIIPYSTLKLFTYKELSLYFSGMPSINIDQMKKYAKFQNFRQEDKEIQWFWQILEEKDDEERANFLFYLTGSYKVPYGGFKEYPIGFNKMIDCKDYLPVAHTCFSVLDLPNYSSKEKMTRLLNKAVKEGKGFSVS